ncbi:MAG TPA: YbgC/FadM family acyl-CoA thioesterase [Gammaproteobacteria bacterium]|nr:YbgC/FadM family acyl-CoA thioesterase [Gammaproteobacteria bacterium]
MLPVRVYLEDTDAQGVVYNASYFRFMERARTEWLRARGIDHDELREEHGVVLVLAAIKARFRAPARLSDMLYVSADVAETRGARVRFAQSVRRADPDGELVCEGVAEVACMDAREGRPRRLPATLVSELKQ